MTLAGQVSAISDSIFDAPDLLATQLDDRLRIRCAAVIVLSHAEMEEAIEEACLSAVTELEANPPPGFAFLAWGLSSVDHAKQLRIGGTTKALSKAYRDLVKNSHGIKRTHLEKLLLPLGIDLSSLELDIDTLESFGSKRGESAHLSPLKARLQNAPSIVRADAITAAASASAVIAAVSVLTEALKERSEPRRAKKTFIDRIMRR